MIFWVNEKKKKTSILIAVFVGQKLTDFLIPSQHSGEVCKKKPSQTVLQEGKRRECFSEHITRKRPKLR